MSYDVKVRIGAETSDLAAGISNAVDHVKKMGTAVESTAGDTRKLDDALTRYMSRLDPAYRAQVLLAQGVGLLDENLKAGNISTDKHAEMLARVEAAYGAATTGAQRNGTAVSGVGRAHGMEVWRIQAFTHSIRASADQLMAGQNPAQVLGMQISQLAMTTTGTSLKLFGMAAAVLAVVGGLALAIAKAEGGKREMSVLEAAFQASGRAGLFNADALKELIHHLSRLPGISRSAAVEIVNEFARARQIGGSMFSGLASIVADFARATGTEAPEAARTLAQSFSEPEAGAKRLDKALGFLSANQLLAIERMSRMGDIASAQQVMFDALKERVQGLATKGLTPLQESTNKLSNAWDNFKATVGATGAIDAAIAALTGLLNVTSKLLGEIDSRIVELLERKRALEEGEATSGLVYGLHLEGVSEIDRQLAVLLAKKKELENWPTLGTGKAAGADSDPASVKSSNRGGVDAGQERVKAAVRLAEQHLDVEMRRKRIQEEIDVLKQAEKNATGQSLEMIRSGIRGLEQERDNLKGKGDASRVESMRQELEDMKAQEEGFLDFSKRQELEFWEGKLSTMRKGSADYAQVHREVYNLRRAIAKEDFDREIADIKVQMEAKRKDGEERVRLAQEIARRTGEAYGLESVQYKQAMREVEAAQREHVEQMRQLKAMEIEATQAQGETELELRRQSLSFQREMGEINARQEVQGLRELEQQQHALELKALQDKLQLQGLEVKERAQINQQIEALQNKHRLKMDQFNKQEAQAFRQQWKGYLDPATNAMAQATTAMIAQGQTLRQSMANVAQAILSQFVSAIFQIAEEWLIKQAMMLVMGETSAIAGAATVRGAALANISAYAAEGAAAAGASVAANPFWGWAMVPEVAEGTYALLSGFSAALAVPSAAGGWDQVPEDQLTQLHKDEMVLSAPIAGMFRNLAAMAKGSLGFSVPKISGWGLPADIASMTRAPEIERSHTSGNGQGQEQRARDSHVHAHFTINALDAKGVDRVLKRNRGALVRALTAAHRDGALGSKE